MKTTQKFFLGMLGYFFYLSGCGIELKGNTTTAKNTGSTSSTTKVIAPALNLADFCVGDFSTCVDGPVTETAPTGSGTSTDPLIIELCPQDSSSGTNPGLLLYASSNTTNLSCTSIVDIDAAVTPSKLVTITAPTDFSPAEDLTCTATNSAGSASYYLSLTAFDCCCFTAGTLVLMADGSSKPIEDVKIGDHVLAGKGKFNRVTDYEQPMLGSRLLYSFNGSSYFVTAEHPFMTIEGWKAIDPKTAMEELPGTNINALTAGDVLILHNNQKTMIETIESKSAEKELRLYNLITSGDETYFVSMNDRFVLIHS